MYALGKLEQLQNIILQRITALELSYQTQIVSSLSISSIPAVASSSSSIPAVASSSSSSETMEFRLSAILISLGANDFVFKRVPFDYYEWTLEARRDTIGAASVDHLCKSIVMVNTQAPTNVIDCRDRNNSKYYLVVIQYVARLNAENIRNFLYSLNNKMIAKKKFNLRLAPEEDSIALTGFVHNAVTCIGMKTDIPVILDEAIVKLNPDYFWLGGGEVDLKLGIRTPEFISAIRPFIVSCSS